MAEKDNDYETQNELEQLRSQVALLMRYVKVLQDKVQSIEKWRGDETYKMPARSFSDFGRGQEKSALGYSIADITRYPYRAEQPESD